MSKKFQIIISILLTSILCGCATGSMNYTPPNQVDIVKSKTIKFSLDKVWSKSIPQLGKKFYTINTIDKNSGLISLSFSANPEQYVDCGSAKIQVSNAAGKRDYNINLSAKSSFYEIYEANTIWKITRNLNLEGRINLIFESISKNETKVTANTRYVLNRSVRSIGGVRGDGTYLPYDTTNNDSISFDPENEISFNGGKTKCRAKGNLEKDILDLISG